MKSFLGHLVIGLILSLIASCSSLESCRSHLSSTQIKNPEATAPEIPLAVDQAFFPLRRHEDGNIYPSYSWDVCMKRFIVCLKWQTKIIYIKDMEWFLNNDWGLIKRPGPRK